MEELIISIMNVYGYLGIFLLIMIENLFPPIPSEVILTFGGFMTTSSNITITGVIIASTLGSVIGAFMLYYIGKILNKERLIKIVTSKYGKLLRVKPKDIESADKWFDTKGYKTVFYCRFIPIVRSLISIPAGMSEMPIKKFTLYTALGSVMWNSILVLIGVYAGEKRTIIVKFIDQFSHVILVLLIISFIVFVIWFYKTKFKKK
ncbi:MAG: DedA family protein [Tenericutes bacterium]|nr:DedA family protein [Mycoplasmatota bacterium]